MEKTDKKQKSTLKKGLSLSVLTFGSRILGLIREMTKGHFLGTGSLSDAFSIAFLIPNLFRRLFAEGSITVAFIPTFRSYLQKEDTEENKEETQNFISATFTLLIFVLVCFVTLCVIFTPLILRIFYSYNKIEDTSSFDEAVVLTRIMFPYLFVISIAAFFQGILNGIKIFSPSGFTPILFNAIVIAMTYILAPHTANPARAMAIGVVTGGTVQALFQLPFVLKNNWKISFTSLKKAFQNPGTRRVLKLIAPTIIGMAAYQVNDLVSTAVANRVGEGIVSSLGFSLRLQELILGICAVTVGTVILPELTGFAKSEQWQDFNNMLTQSIKIMILICIPVTAYCLIMKENLIALLFNTGKFDEKSVESTVSVFRWHIIGLLFIAVNRIVTPAFYAQEDAVRPTIAGCISFAINIILAFVLSIFMKGPGIALALTVSSAANTVVLFIFLSRKENIQAGTVVKSSLLYVPRIALFSVIASVPAYFLKAPLVKVMAGHTRWISQGVPVLVTGIVFAAIGVGLLVVTKDPLLRTVLRKRNKKN